MNRTIQFGDRRTLEPQMDYCRLDYNFNWDAADTLDLTIQIFDPHQTILYKRFCNLTAAQADALIQTYLGSDWNNVLIQQFRDWAVCYLQRSKSTYHSEISRSPASAQSAVSLPRDARSQKSQSSAARRSVRRQQLYRKSLRLPKSWQAAKAVGTRMVAAGLAIGAIALAAKSVHQVAYHLPLRINHPLLTQDDNQAHDSHKLPQAGSKRWFWQWVSDSEEAQDLSEEGADLASKASQRSAMASSSQRPIIRVESSSHHPFEQAVALAEQAVLEGRIADSARAWKNLAQQWHEAAQLMEQVPDSDPRYELAQNRADLYSDHREQSLVEMALYSVVFPIDNRHHPSGSKVSEAQEKVSSEARARSSQVVSEQPASANLSALEAIAPETNRCQAEAEALVRPILTSAQYRLGQWGIYAQSLTSGQRLYERNSDSFFVPASNIKLYTTAAAASWLAKLQSQPSNAQPTEQSEEQVSKHLSETSANVETQQPTASPTLSTNLGEKSSINPSSSVAELASLSADVQTLIQNANLYSNNWSAELLLEQIGGSLQIKALLDDLGIDPIGYHMDDGSGLSRSNLVTPRSLVETLTIMHNTAGAELFYGTLPIAAQRGTLRHRFHNTIADGNLRAKTGTLMGVRSLSGYFDHAIHGRVAFSIVVNYPGHSGYGLNAPIDDIVVQLMQMGDCASSS